MSSSSSLSGARRRRAGGGSGPTSSGQQPQRPPQQQQQQQQQQQPQINPFMLLQQHDMKINMIEQTVREFMLNRTIDMKQGNDQSLNNSIDLLIITLLYLCFQYSLFLGSPFLLSFNDFNSSMQITPAFQPTCFICIPKS